MPGDRRENQPLTHVRHKKEKRVSRDVMVGRVLRAHLVHQGSVESLATEGVMDLRYCIVITFTTNLVLIFLVHEIVIITIVVIG